MNHAAVYALYPQVVTVDDGGGARDAAGNIVEVDINAVSEWVDPVAYQRDRASEYPSLADQLDMLYHDKINNTNTWLDAIQAVKNKYPKS